MPTQLPAIGLNDAYDTADVSQFLRIVRRRIRVVLILTTLTGGGALLHTLFAKPQFTVQGALYLGETQQDASGSGDSVNLLAFSTQSDVETQIELLTTGTLVERAILETGLNTFIRPVSEPPLTYWRWRIYDHGDTNSFLPASNSLQVVNATMPGSYKLVTTRDNSYKLYAVDGLLRQPKLVLSGQIGEIAQTPNGSILVRFARTDDATTGKISSGLIYRLDIAQPDALAKALTSGMLNVGTGGSPTQPTKLATLQFRWPNPYQAKIFVNQMMSDYITTQLQWKTESASVTESFVTAQLAKVSQQLAQADRNLSEYQAQTGIIDPQQSNQATAAEMTELRNQRSDILLRMQNLQQMHDALAAETASINQYMISQTEDPLLSTLGASLSQAEVKLSELRSEYTGSAQTVKIQQAQVNQLRLSIRSLIENDLNNATHNLANIDSLISNYRTEQKAQPAESLKVESLKRTSDQLSELYTLLTQKAEQAQISKAATMIDTRIVTPAQLPISPTSPRLVLNVLLGAFVGFVASLALIYVRYGFSGRYESEEQIRRAITLPIYGAVPRLSTSPRLLTSQGGSERPITLGAFSESFRLIRRNIYRYAKSNRATAVLVISANAQDGKTTIAANLAKSLADDGKCVLLMNCDIYVSRAQSMIDSSDQPGLTDWIRTGKRSAMQSWPGGNFRVLPAGTVRPERGAQLNEAALAAIIDQLTREFDYLILDSPPLPVVSDGLLLGNFADLILSVINVSHTIKRVFDLHNELIETLNKPHGVIINGADSESYGNSSAYFISASRRRPKFVSWLRGN